MWQLRIIVTCIGIGIICGPLIGVMFFHYETTSFSLASLKAMLAANGKLVTVFAAMGGVVGLVMGFVKVAKGEREIK